MSESPSPQAAAPLDGAPAPEAEAFDTEALALAIAEAAWDRKARNVRALDVRGLVSYTDFIIVCHGTSPRHAQSIADNVIYELRPTKVRPLGIEGVDRGEWILVDFGDAVLHVFNEPTRVEYGLESVYADAPRMPLDAPADLEDPEAAAALRR
ncbi:MAG: ribosome silencing factor [Myxococcales bacterium]|nr:ribosome silencing factor [Myxococcales bacterium]